MSCIAVEIHRDHVIPHSINMDSRANTFSDVGVKVPQWVLTLQGSRDASCNGRMESSHFGKCPGGLSKIVPCTRHSVALILKESAKIDAVYIKSKSSSKQIQLKK